MSFLLQVSRVKDSSCNMLCCVTTFWSLCCVRLEGGFYIGTLGVLGGRRGINGEYFYTLFIFIMIDHLCVIGKSGNKKASDSSPRQYFCLNRPMIKMVTSFACFNRGNLPFCCIASFLAINFGVPSLPFA